MSKIPDIVTELARPIVEEEGCSLWDVEYVREAGSRYLRIYIDKAGGVDIDDCERVHRAIDPILDEADPIEDAYYLNVSSPGIERVLRTEAHLIASIGERVELRLFAAIDGQKTVRGTLAAVDAEAVTLAEGGRYPRTAIAKAQTVYFD